MGVWGEHRSLAIDILNLFCSISLLLRRLEFRSLILLRVLLKIIDAREVVFLGWPTLQLVLHRKKLLVLDEERVPNWGLGMVLGVMRGEILFMAGVEAPPGDRVIPHRFFHFRGIL